MTANGRGSKGRVRVEMGGEREERVTAKQGKWGEGTKRGRQGERKEWLRKDRCGKGGGRREEWVK